MAITMETIQANFNTSHVHTHTHTWKLLLQQFMVNKVLVQGLRTLQKSNDEEKHEEYLHHSD